MEITFNADEIIEIAERIERNIPSAKATRNTRTPSGHSRFLKGGDDE
ncbi:hypothetical protein GH141_08435 [bacterium]|nr:hypothetical protein [bacterium]